MVEISYRLNGLVRILYDNISITATCMIKLSQVNLLHI